MAASFYVCDRKRGDIKQVNYGSEKPLVFFKTLLLNINQQQTAATKETCGVIGLVLNRTTRMSLCGLIRFYGNLVPFHVEQIRVGLELVLLLVVAFRVSECLLLSDLSQSKEGDPFRGV